MDLKKSHGVFNLDLPAKLTGKGLGPQFMLETKASVTTESDYTMF